MTHHAARPRIERRPDARHRIRTWTGDLASLLLTGRRFDDLAPGDAAFVGTQVLGNLSGRRARLRRAARSASTRCASAGPRRPTLRARSDRVATELDPTTRLTFGKSIGTDLDVTFSQSLRDGDAQTWIVDYLPARRLELRFVSDDDDLRSYGFRHDVDLRRRRRGRLKPRPRRAPRAARGVGERVGRSRAARGTLARACSGLSPGDRFDFVEWQADRDRLEALYSDAGLPHGARHAGTVGGTRTVSLSIYQITAGPADGDRRERDRSGCGRFARGSRRRGRSRSSTTSSTTRRRRSSASTGGRRLSAAGVDARVVDEGDDQDAVDHRRPRQRRRRGRACASTGADEALTARSSSGWTARAWSSRP